MKKPSNDNSSSAPEHGSVMELGAAVSSSPQSALAAALILRPTSRSLTITQGDICFIVTMSGFVESVTVRPREADDPAQSVVIVEVDGCQGTSMQS